MLDIRVPKLSGKRTVQITLNEFKAGTNTLIDDARLEPNMAKESINMVLVQDGRWKPRWGTKTYGVAITGESVLDGVGEFIASDGTREVIAVGGTTGKIWKSVNDCASWAQLGSVVFTPGHQTYFLQIKSSFYITNGVDDLVLYNGTTATQYAELDAPENLAGALTGLGAGDYHYFYKVTALNNVGETIASTELDKAVSKKRDDWDSSNYITLSWDAVATATKYQVYISENTGQEVLLASANAVSYVDDGTAVPNPYVETPLAGTTTAPLLEQMCNSGNRIWSIGSNGAVYFGGTGQYTTYFNEFFGGGYIYLEKGGRETPKAVKHFRTGSGVGIATVFTSDPAGRGSVWQISLDAVTVGATSFVVPVPTKVINGIGTVGGLAVSDSENDILTASKIGIHSLKIKPQLYNVISSDELSIPIRPSYQSLVGSLFDTISSYYYKNKHFFSVPRSTRNDTTMIYDTERNCFIWYWDIGAKQFLTHTDSSEVTRLLTVPVSGGALVEWNENFTNDDGEAITTSYQSGLIPVSDDKKSFVKIKNVIFEIGRPKGTITLEVSGLQKKRGFTLLASRTITNNLSSVDITDALLDDIWLDDTLTVPVSYSQASSKKLLKVNKVVDKIQFKVSSTSSDTDYTVLLIQANGVLSSTSIPVDWKN